MLRILEKYLYFMMKKYIVPIKWESTKNSDVKRRIKEECYHR